MSDTTQQTAGPNRRGFLRTGSALAAGGLVFGDWRPAHAADIPKRRLGRTTFGVTTISFGAIRINDRSHVRVLDHAIDQGINLVHVSPAYQNGEAIKIVGEVMKRKRDKVFLALKLDPNEGEVDKALRTLNTTWVDILIPPRNRPGQMADERVKAGFAALKEKGKIRASGFACGHDDGPGTLRAAIRAGFWDTVLLMYNVGTRGQYDPIVAQAVEQQKMGFLVMKASNDLPRRDTAQWQAGLRNLLGNENITSLTLGVDAIQHVDQNIAAVMQRNAAADRQFARYAASCSADISTLWHKCQAACPRDVAVEEYLRAEMYRKRGDVDLAREVVERIPTRRSVAMCNNCGRCNQACQHQVDVMRTIREVSRP